MLWLIWLVVAIVALAGELLTLGLFLASIALAAAVVAALSPLIVLPAQVAVFAGLSLVLLLFVRPVALRVLPSASTSDTQPHLGPSEEVGVAVERIDRGHGQIRVGTGEFWSARPAQPDLVLEPGRQVEIVGMDGLTALVQPVAAQLPIGAASTGNAFGLSARELEVLQLVSAGLSNQEIADRLFLSPRTVHHHVSHILDKMGADNRVEAVRTAMERGLVSTAPNTDERTSD